MTALTAPLLAAALAAPGLSYRVFTTDNGLPQNSVYAIDQTPDGYLWIATRDGLVRFDGHRMTVVNHAEVPEILSNRILALRVDREGSLWIGTEDGGVTRMTHGEFRTFGVADGLPDAAVGGIQQDAEGRIWVSTMRGLAVFDGVRFVRTQEVTARPGEKTELYWVAFVRDTGVRFLEPDGKLADYVWPEGHRPIAQFLDPRGALWSRTTAHTLLKSEHGRTTELAAPVAPGPPSTNLRYAATEGKDGRTWLLLDGRLSVLENGSWRTFGPDLPAAATNPIAMIEDAEGSLWIGGESGLVQAFPTPVRTVAPEAPGDEHNFYPIAEDRTGAVWAGSQNMAFRVDGDRFTRSATFFTAVRPEADGSVLVGDNDGVRRERSDGRVETVYRLPGTVLDILHDRRGTVWAGTSEGLVRIDPSGAIRRFGVADGLAGARVGALIERASGAIWAGCYGGLSRIDGDRVTTWKIKDGLSSETIRALYEDERGVLWIGTYDGGLTRFADGKLVVIRKRDGLFDDGAFAIVDDRTGRLWMSCNRGIYAVARAELDAFAEGRARSVTSLAFGRMDGMASAECNGGYQPAGFRKSDGTLWFATQQGIAIVDPRLVGENTVAPNVAIEEIASERRAHDVAREATLDPSESRLEVRFTATTFVRPEQARFRYRMEGLDDEWEDAGTARFARYSHLPPGHYVFHVAAANADGVWNEKGASVAIRVTPAWWQTVWFRGGTVVLGLGLVGLGVRSRFERLKRRREEQDLFSRQLIASQEAERKRIAGELHDGIGQTLVVIRNRAQMGLRDGTTSDDARRQMEEIVEATGDGIEEVRKVAYNLRPYQLDRLGLTRAIEALVEQTAESSGMTIASHLDPLDGLFAEGDEIGVYRIVQEALSNMLRHAHATRAGVTAKAGEGRVEITVEDDGRGFDPASLPADRPGMGLAGIAERARILGGRHTVQSLPGRGTKIVVSLPTRGGSA
ncbi:MAG TPA: two-component regulator propeller domain-containing protein [Candidatus Polarisedimenticolaceae bacterium]|nr:two-component regulator propeller domain-containing protein [Candidatus Polarisedimenticolaceae bacterium]